MNKEQRIAFLQGKHEALHSLLGHYEDLDLIIEARLEKIEQLLEKLGETP